MFYIVLNCSILGAGTREAELIDALKLLLSRINAGSIPITDEMVRRARESGLLTTGGIHTTHVSVPSGRIHECYICIQIVSIHSRSCLLMQDLVICYGNRMLRK